MDAFNLPAPPAAPPVARLQRIQRWRWNELREKVAYRYFCWRSALKSALANTICSVFASLSTAAGATLAGKQDVQGGCKCSLC